MVILLDNGHGADTRGKCSPDALKNILGSPYYFREYEWAREIASACWSVLKVRGYDVRLLVPEERDIPLAERVRRVNAVCDKYGAANVILVSIHVNAAGDGTRWMNARGWSIYTTKGETKADALADHIHAVARNEFKAPLKVRTNFDKYLQRDFEENFYILKNTKCPAMLVENFFQDNKDDVAYLKSDKGKGQCIHVITQGIENYITALNHGKHS